MQEIIKETFNSKKEEKKMSGIKIKLETQGFLQGKRYGHKEHFRMDDAHNDYAGLKLDELQIKSTITSYEDIKSLIKFLTNVSPCFLPPPKL